ncbi:GntR family transcriptional regulator [Streptomyces sp. NRRL F-5126]|uniref:GntR family transcriptional regulator n=1 Tax=Streptomyces sp. NRRL F-5126 TaxID=1463857 RepID=UPI0004C4B65F|nr:GntR family transcriptional regulator [Streptomyces sp. NRRL F-5126]
MSVTARQIADGLRERIRSRELAPGDRLPGEPALVREHGVAKETARRALSMLVTEGLAVRRRGSGTYVREFRPIRRTAGRRLSRDVWGAGQSIWAAEVRGRELTVTDLEVGEEPVPEEVAPLLGLPDEAAVVVRRRRYLVDGEPVQLATSYLPADLVRDSPAARAETGPGGLYARLGELGLEPAGFTEELRARMPDPSESDRLHLSEGTPVVEICRVAYTAEGRAVDVTWMLLDAGVYTLVYDVTS